MTIYPYQKFKIRKKIEFFLFSIQKILIKTFYQTSQIQKIQIKNLKTIQNDMQTIKQLIKMGDCFNSIQLLRFRKETQYRTFTGGLISIGIIVTIIIAFANMIIETMNRTIINYTLNSQRDSDPSLSIVDISKGKFMFGAGIRGYNLSSERRLFDVFLVQFYTSYDRQGTYQFLPMQACTKQHSAMLPDVVSKFDEMRVGNWLCPTKTAVLKLQGKVTSQSYYQFVIELFPCNNYTDPNRPCATQEEIDTYFQVVPLNYFSFYYANSVINSDQPEYLKYYLEDRAYMVFGSQLGAQFDMYIKQANFITDNSIWPFQDLKTDFAFNIEFSPILYPFSVGQNGGLLGAFDIMKDATSQIYTRKVQKIFVVFSFMGGLVGAMMTGLFIMNIYTNFAYQIALSSQIFTVKQTSQGKQWFQMSSGTLSSILCFFKYHIYSLLIRLTEKVRSPFYDQIDECRQEINEQLDIKNIIKRIVFLQYHLSFSLQDFQLTELQQGRPLHPAEIRRLRKKILSDTRLSVNDELESEIGSIKEPRNVIFNILKSQDSNITQNIEPKSRRKLSFNLSKCLKDKQDILEEDLNNDQMQETIQKNNLGKIIIYNEKKSEERKQIDNIKKLRLSAQSGNAISKKLLAVINRSASKEEKIENLSDNLN